jgi:hypothetical protein
MDDLTIACVLWRGDFRDRNYSIKDVLRLFKMAHSRLTIPHRFVCLTNDRDSMEHKAWVDQGKSLDWIPLLYNLPGWWSKLELFRPDLPITGKILYLDLDVFLVDSIDELATFSDGLTFCPPICDGKIDPTPRTKTEGPDAGKTTIQRFQSSAMSWMAGDCQINIPEVLDMGIVDHYRGDQDFFGEQFSDTGKTFPLKWFDKLKNCFDAKSKPDLKVVLGNPKPMWKRALRGESAWIKRAAQC